MALHLFTLAAALAAGAPLDAATREKDVLKEVTAPPGFQVTLFAAPPQVSYPVFVAAAPDGTVYVSSDKNGSTDRKPSRGSVVRLRDTDGDGRADEAKRFVADVDSPRGLVWDRDRLYLLHPPHLSAFIDRNGDGVADERKVLVKDIAFGFADRPADHTSNGVTLGIDGWLYLAIGDFGFREAEGTDGRKLQLRGGGVVRVRPDGTGLELFARGTRNIVEVGLSPRLEGFSRDNTNDGDGWDIRLHHFVPLGEHGYPSLYKRFTGEILAPLADYGGGSGCGAAYIAEPGFPDGHGDALYTADWGRQRVFVHRATPKGASFTVDQRDFLVMPRPTDLDVDASGHVFAASWKGAVFNYAGEDVGYLVRVTPKDHRAEPLPSLGRAGARTLVGLLRSPSHRRRLAAQRELLARRLDAGTARAVQALQADRAQPADVRIAAMFLLAQAGGPGRAQALARGARDPELAPLALRALGDGKGTHAAIVPALASADARARREAVAALARLGARAQGPDIARRLHDEDPVVRHVAARALAALGAADAALAIVDDANAPEVARAGALHALGLIHRPDVVDALAARVSRERDAARRAGLLSTVARLHFHEGAWKGDSWGTRPDTTGPYYQPEPWAGTKAAAAALKTALAQSGAEEAATIVGILNRHKVDLDDALERALVLAGQRADMVPAAIAQLVRREAIPPAARPLLLRAARDPATASAVRADTVVALSRLRDPDALDAALAALTRLADAKDPDAERSLSRARRAFLRSPVLEAQHAKIEALASGQGASSAWATAALMAMNGSDRVAPEVRLAAGKLIEDGWARTERRPLMLQAAALGDHRAQRERVLAALDDRDPRVAEAARKAAAVLRIERPRRAPPGALIEKLAVPAVVTAVTSVHGDPARGAELFERQGCAQCHTTSADQPLRGPFLGNIAATYKRAELAEAILLPSKSLAQGFVTHHFELRDGGSHEGFVVREASGEIVIRTITGDEVSIRAGDVKQRTKLDRSSMPEGLAANLTVGELAALLDYLEALARK